MEKLLHNVRLEKDACGTGFVANVSGERSHEIVEKALEAVANLSHRGGAGADGKSGDGAGLLTQIPHALFKKMLARQNIRPVASRDLAVGVLFLPPEDQPDFARQKAACQAVIRRCLKRQGLQFLAWREVPVERSVLGDKALETCPSILQLLVARPAVLSDDTAFERELYFARKRIEKEVAAADIEPFYFVSFSHRTIVYKGLFLASQLRQFYLDLQEPDFETALAVFHQRFSTNTFPTWCLSQPFRMLAHNGEINTIGGNENWMRAWEAELDSRRFGRKLAGLAPILQSASSDSAKLDSAAELLTMTGRNILHSLLMLLPEAYENISEVDADLRAFYEYHEALMEPWDGPAAVTFSDGVVVGARLDRNGLRPARYVVTHDGLVVLASEAGVVDVQPQDIKEKGRLGPGQMLAVDVQAHAIFHDAKIKKLFAAKKPYAQWLSKNKRTLPRTLADESSWQDSRVPEDLIRKKIAFAYGKEVLDRYLQPMVTTSKVAMGSMGDDAPLPPFSDTPRMLCSYFKQRFAQVTNPPIDPIRERLVMSLSTRIGFRGNFLEERESHTRFIALSSPILSRDEFEWLCNLEDQHFQTRRLSAVFKADDGPAGMASALEALLRKAVRAVDRGHSILIISDRGISETLAPIPSLLAVSAVHHHLIRTGRRMRVSIVAETGKARNEHHVACLIGFGATCVYPFLAYETIAWQIEQKHFGELKVMEAVSNYKQSLESGLLKIMAKMGISTVGSYHGAQLFEAIGLQQELIDRHFTGTESRLGGVGLEAIASDVLKLHRHAFHGNGTLPDYGIYRFRKNGEPHANNPEMMRSLHRAVRSPGNQTDYNAFANSVNERRPIKLRDLLTVESDRAAIAVSQVESAENIVRRFCTTAMSMGALSHEAHLALAIGMNRLGAKSNSGEGGEDPRRYRGDGRSGIFNNRAFGWKKGDSANSKIKQIASGRFGVTPAYLQSAGELEIKMAQGAKPGEGGQLPGIKVSKAIAAIRHSIEGTTLISPPPHHDIYSIEDLAQLIYDLRTVNPRAAVSVKLVAESGVGTVAAGVAKAGADGINISGHDGGTGASPLSSIKNVGISWEIGLAEAQQVLIKNNLRDRVFLRIDGGLKSGRDVVFAALLGADEFGFGTSALLAIGCVMARQCHLNTCPVGVATQREELRARFKGTPDHVVNYMMFVANEVRSHLARMGYRTLDEIVGRSDLLIPRNDVQLPKADTLDVGFLFARTETLAKKKTSASAAPRPRLDDRFLPRIAEAVQCGQDVWLSSAIRNTNRAVGARIAGEIARNCDDPGLRHATVHLSLSGTAGQSFGAFCVKGLRLTLIGEANDYVGKGMAGGEIVIMPPARCRLPTGASVIMGNTVLYGATGGRLLAAGSAGERFGVRNSGATAVVEGVGDHGCEYMTGGRVVVLGEVGNNFGAGMTGGTAYVLDGAGLLAARCNRLSVRLAGLKRVDATWLKKIMVEHSRATGSARAKAILRAWHDYLPRFVKVSPLVNGENGLEVGRVQHTDSLPVQVNQEPS